MVLEWSSTYLDPESFFARTTENRELRRRVLGLASLGWHRSDYNQGQGQVHLWPVQVLELKASTPTMSIATHPSIKTARNIAGGSFDLSNFL